MVKLQHYTLLFVLLASGCLQENRGPIEPSIIFDLGLGALEDQIRLFAYGEGPQNLQNYFVFEQGLFYISNPQGRKVMVFSSSGELIRSWFNPDHNPAPVRLTLANSQDTQSNRMAYPFPFRDNGHFDVGTDGELYVASTLSERESIYDPQRDSLLENIILRFSSRGEFLDQLGQEGVGGEPLPLIYGVRALDDGRLAVITRDPIQWGVYLFSPSGERLRYFGIQKEVLGELLSVGPDVVPVIDQIYVPKNQGAFYVKITLFKKDISQGSQAVNSITAAEVLLLRYDLMSGNFQESFPLPVIQKEDVNSGAFETNVIDFPLNLLGVTDQEALVFLSSIDRNNVHYVVLNQEGRNLLQGSLFLPESKQEFSSFFLADDGRIFAMVSDGYTVEMLLWDTQSQIGGLNGKID